MTDEAETTPRDRGEAGDPPVSQPLARNVDDLMQRRQSEWANERLTEKAAARIASFAGSIWSILAHACVFGTWILVNLGVVPVVRPWDPTMVMLSMIASVEAIFLTTFVLMNQRRQSRLEDDRAELTLQISLLAEHETTKLAGLVLAIARHLDIPLPQGSDIDELTKTVAPNAVLDEIESKRPQGP